MRRENSPFTLTRLLRGLLGSVSGMAFATAAMAGPVGGNVAAGSADITGQGTSAVTVNQNSDRVVIDWANFDTQSHERVDFLQPGSNSVALNRITNGSATQFDGALRANGRVILMNANGVIFGPNSTVDVNSLVATTANISNDAFMNGGDQLKFDQPGNPNAVIVNNGHITAKEAGLVGFVAPNVINNGVINAKLGKIHLASGDRFTYDLYGDGLVEIAAGDAVNKQLVENNGALHADGGTIALTAVQARNAVDNVIRNNGVIEAKTVSQKNGVIILGGSKKIEQSGRIEASGKQSGEKGGTVKLGADHIVLAQGSVIDTSADVGGGTVLVGGEYKGRRLEDDVQQYGLVTAQNVTMENGASIVNNAITSGDGGRTILWADDRTVFAGSIQAKGGATGGNGGFVETSGKNELKVTGLVSLFAPTEGQSGGGKVGTWLLDPTNITIYNRSGSGDGTNTFTTAQLETMSASANISLVADNSLTLDMTNDTLTVAANRDISLTATSGTISSNSNGTIVTSGTGSITLTAGTDILFANDLDLNANGTGSVTLRANGTISYTGSGDITTAGGAITLNSDRDANNSGAISLGNGTVLTSNGGNITLGGGGDPVNLSAYGDASYAQGIALTGATIDARGSATGGTISLSGRGWSGSTATTATTSASGVFLNTGIVQTNFNGGISVNGTGGGTGAANTTVGVFLYNGSSLNAVNGTINVNGTGGAGSGTFKYGTTFSVVGINSIISTGVGDVNVTGTSNDGGINFGSASGGIFSKDGAVTITGISTAANGIINTQAGGTRTIGGAAATGTITLISNSLSFLTAPVIQTTGDVIIRPYTAATTVGIGSGTGTLAITDAILSNITTGGTLWLGGYGLTGAETGYWNSSGLMTLNTTRSFANNVNFLSGANIVSGGASTITLTSAASTILHAVGDINITHDLDFTSTGTGSVTLRANGTISYTGSGDITTAGGAITLNSDRDANNDGAISLVVNTVLTSNGGDITLGGGSNPLTTAAYGNASYVQGVFINGATINASGSSFGGTISISGNGYLLGTGTDVYVDKAHGVYLKGTTAASNVLTNFNGTITVTGTGSGTGSGSGVGVYLYNGTSISAVNGAINIQGTGGGGSTSSGGDGVGISGSASNKIQSTGNGSITILGTGQSTSGTNNNNGFSTNASAGNGVLSAGGSITITGIAGTGVNSVGFLNGPNSGNIGGASSSGMVTLIFDSVNTNQNVPTIQTTGDVVIRPYSTGKTIGIGSGAGGLNISDAWLNNITAGGTLWLGGYGLTGAETGYWNSSGLMTLNTTRSFAGNVNFLSGASIVSGANSTITLTGAASTILHAVGDIYFTHDLDLTSTGTGSVTLRANGNIAYTGSGDITTTSGAITLNADRDANNSGAIALGAGTALVTTGGNITLGGGVNPTTTAAVGNATYNQGIALTSATLNAAGGAINVTGLGYSLGAGATHAGAIGVKLESTSLTVTGAGTITVTGTGAGTTTGYGVDIVNTSSINAVNGAINVTGTGGAGSTADNPGILFSGGGVNTINSTGTGSITVTGIGGGSAGSSSNQGILINTGTGGGIISKDGSVTITGIAGYGGTGTGSYGLAGGSSPKIGGPNATGTITLIADTTISSTPVQTTGDVIIRPYTAGTTVGVGNGTGATLSLTDSILNAINYGGTLWLGGYGLTGAETGYWNISGVMTLNSTRSFSKNVNFISGANIVSGGASTITLTGTASTVLYALGDISITHDLDLTASGTGSITERANGNIVYSASGDITTTGGAIILNSDRDANNDGMINLNGGTVLTSNGGNITLGGGANPATTAAVGNATYLQGIQLYGAVLDARGTSSGGNIVMNGRGYALNTGSTAHGILMDNTGSVVQTSHSGNITMTGTGGGTGTAFTNIGVFLRVNALVTAVNGTITVTGTGSAGTGGDNVGIVLSSSGANKIESTGTGDIVMTGTGGGGAGTHGITFNAVSGGGALSKDGTITATGIAGAGGGSVGIAFGVNSSIIGGTNATNTITLIANTLSSTNPNTIRTTGDVVIRPYTAGTTVGIGSAGGALNISDAFLNTITTGGTLWLGGYGLTGAETGYWNSSGQMTLATTRSFANNVNFISGNNISSGANSTITLTGAASTVLYSLNAISLTHDLDLTATGTGSITLRANNSIVYTGSGDITTAGGAITLNADRNADSVGSIYLGAGTALTSNGGNIILGGGANPLTVAAYGTSAYNQGIALVGATLNASGTSSGGSITLMGNGNLTGTGTDVNVDGAHGIFLDNATVQTSHNGNITLTGIGTGTTASTGEGVRVYNTSLVSTADGNLSITGTGSNTVNTGVNKYGISLSSVGTNILRSTGSGNVNITGIGGAITGNNNGIVVNSVGGGIYANSGITTIIGNGGLGASGINMASGTLIGTGTTTGAINIITNTINANPTVTTTGTVTLRPYTDGTSIGIAGAAGTLQLTSTLLNAISASTIVVGSSTNDHLITANAYTWNANASLLSKSFDIVLNGLQTGALNKNFSAAITSGTGKITIGAGGGVTTTGTGTITLNTANQITTTGAGGLTSASGNIALTATNGIALTYATPITSTSGNINFNSALTSTASQVFNAGTGTITTAAMAMGANNLTLTADDLVIGGALSGTGTLTLQPGSTSRVVCVNGTGATYCTGGFFSLSTAEIANLSDGWAGITIGRSDGTGTMEIGATSWTDPVTFLNNFRTQINGNLTATGNGSFTINAGSGGWVNFNGSPVTISTAGTNVAFTAGGTGSVSYNTTINTSGGNVSLSLPLTLPSAIAAGNTLSINAGSGAVSLSTIANGSTSYQTNLTVNAGTITLNGALGSGNGMGDVNLTATNSMSLPAITTAAGKTLNAIVTGAGNAITTTGAIATGTGGNITLTADDLILGGNLSGTGTLTLQPNAASRSVCVNSVSANCTASYLNLSTAEIAYFQDGWSGITIGRSDGTGTVSVGASNWVDPITFKNNFRTEIGGAVAGTGNASFNFATGSGGGINLNSATISTAGQAVTLGASTSTSVLVNLGTGNSITTNGGSVTLPGDIVFPASATNDRTLSIDAGTGNVSLKGLVNTLSTYTLGLTVNANAITISGAMGVTNGMGNLTLTSVNSLTLPTITTAAGKTVSATVTGAGNNITTSGAIATGAGGNITLTADDLVIGHALSGTGTVTLRPSGTSRNVCINNTSSANCLSSNLNLSTAEIAYLTNGWSGIVIGSNSNTAAMEVNNISGSVTFTDPVVFLNNGAIYLYNTISGVGDASLVFNAGASNGVFMQSAYGTTISTKGKDISFINNGTRIYSAVTIDSSNGNISFGTNGVNGGASTSNSLVINAGTGTITAPGGFTNNSSASNPFTVSLSANAFSFGSGAWGGTYGLGDVTLNSVASMSLPGATTFAGKNFNAIVTGAGNSITTTGAIATGTGGNITLAADDLVIGGALSGTGTLTLQPNSNSRNICVNDPGAAACASNVLGLSTAELAYLTDGWTGINIGSNSGTGTTYIGTASFADPVNFRVPNTTYLDGVLTGTGNASFNTAGEVYGRNGSIVTAGQAVTLNSATVEDGMSITTNGGAISTVGRLRISSTTNSLAAVTLSSGGGNITINGVLSETGTGSVVGKNVTLNAGAGTVALGNTYNGNYNLLLNGATITTNGPWGATTPVGNVTVTSVNSLSLPTITTAAGKTLNATVTGAGNSITTTGAIATGAGGNITLTADDLVIGGALSGTGTVTLRPNSNSRNVCVNYIGGSNCTNYLGLSTSEIANLINGWSSIIVGSLSNTATMVVSTSTWNDPVSLINNSRMQIQGNAIISGNDNASLTFNSGSSGYIEFNLNPTYLSTSGQSISLSGTSYKINSNVSFSTSGGNIVFDNLGYIYLPSSTIVSTSLSLDAGSGIISLPSIQNNSSTYSLGLSAIGGGFNFSGNIGVASGTSPLGIVSLTSAGSIILPTIASSSVFATVTGAGNSITTTGAIATGTGGNITLTSDDVVIGGALSGTGTLTLRPNSLSRVVKVNDGLDNGTAYFLDNTELARLTNGWNLVNIGRSDSVAALRLGVSSWVDPIVFNSGSSVDVLGDVTGTDNASLTTAGNGAANLYSNMTTAGGKIDLSNSGYVYTTGAGTTLSTNGGNILLKDINLGSLTGSGAMNVLSGGGNITVNGGIGTNSSSTGKLVNLNAGTGNVLLNSTVNGTGDVTLTGNAITASGIMGSAGTRLGTVTLNSTGDLSLPTIYASNIVANVSGAGNKITTGTLSAGTGGNVTLTADDVVIGGPVSGTGTLTLQPNSISRVVNINRGTADGSNFNLSTADVAQLADGWSGILVGRTNSTADINLDASTWTDPLILRGYSGYTNLYGFTGTGNGALTAAGAYTPVVLAGNVTTAGGAVTLNNGSSQMFLNSGNITTNGGAFSMTGPLVYNAGNTGGFALSTAGGNITLGTITESGGSAAGKAMNFDAGNGTILFGGTVNTGANITASANTITANNIWGGTTALGNVALNTVSGLDLHSITANTIVAQATGATGDITLSSGTRLTATGVGNALVLSAARNFTNLSDAAALSTPAGRWLVYSKNLVNNTRGGLLPNAAALYGKTYASDAPATIAAGNRFIFSDAAGTAPVITLVADNKTKVYGSVNGSLTYTVNGTFGAGDNFANSFSGAPVIGTTVTTGSNAGSYAITLANGTVSSNLGYQVVYQNGTYTVDKANLMITANDQIKAYGTSFVFTGREYAVQGLVNGNTVSSVALSSPGADVLAPASLVPYVISASGATGTGLSNYNITYVSGKLSINLTSGGDTPSILPNYKQVFSPTADTSVKIVTSVDNNEQPSSIIVTQMSPSAVKPYNCLYTVVGFADMDAGVNGSCK